MHSPARAAAAAAYLPRPASPCLACKISRCRRHHTSSHKVAPVCVRPLASPSCLLPRCRACCLAVVPARCLPRACADEDGSGTLEVDELQTLFTTKLSIRKSDDEIRQIFAEVKGPDATDYESVDVHEFKRVVDRIKAHDGEPSAPPPDEAEGRWEIPVGEIRGGPERVRARARGGGG